MAHYLPPHLLSYFEPRPPLEYKQPEELRKKPFAGHTGVSDYLALLRSEAATVPPPVARETRDTVKARERANGIKRHRRHLIARLSHYQPKSQYNDPAKHTSDAYKTLFVGRLHYSLTEENVKQEFEYYGPVVSCHLVRDRTGKSRGYAFVQFASSKHFTEAFKDADGRKIAGRRIVVDVERGRTVKNWRPRRLGGGLGGTRKGDKSLNNFASGRDTGAVVSNSKASSSDRRASEYESSSRDSRYNNHYHSNPSPSHSHSANGSVNGREYGRSRSPSRHDGPGEKWDRERLRYRAEDTPAPSLHQR